MRLWFTDPEAPLQRGWVKRFAARDWTVDFPRGAMASTVTQADERSLSVEASFLREGDLVGLIYESEDRHSHPAQKRLTKRDYSNCTLQFRWRSTGLIPLDAVNGPVLTIEGRDEQGAPASWYVRLWNYAVGTPQDAVVKLDFSALDAGFMLPSEAVRVWPKDIDRMFFGLVAPGYRAASQVSFPQPVRASLEISDIQSHGSGSVIDVNDAWSPEHGFGACTAYDDMYNLSPERIVRGIEATGFRGTISHYIGMSHYFALDGAGLVDPTKPMNAAALAWHRDFARAAAARGFDVIWALSFELLDMFCPAAWKQRAFDGQPAATGYEPPSTLLSPANTAAMTYLQSLARTLMGLATDAGLAPQLQVGEPWWWVRADGAICCYDDSAKTAFGGAPANIANVRAGLTSEQKAVLDQAGAILADATAGIVAAARTVAPNLVSHVLPYLPSILTKDAPEVVRANLPIGWAKPAFDRFQVEDYEWVTGRRTAEREAAYDLIETRLQYPPSAQDYYAGFVAEAADRQDWNGIKSAAVSARHRGNERVFIWAMPQWNRDGVTLFGEESDVTPFEDVQFPISIGAEASVAPSFSTNIVTSASGHEFRNVNWQQARLRFDAGPGVRGEAELGELLRFFRARRGPAVAFRFRDPFDFSSNGMQDAPSPSDQLIGTGDGAQREFALVKVYGEGERRRITRPAVGSVRVSLDGVERSGGWSLGQLGSIVFDVPPGDGVAVRAGFYFDVPVRFADDRIEVNRASFLAGEAPSVPLVEVREQ